MTNILTCVYCGMAYPEGTPPHGSQILTDHIKVCEKHPMREAEARIKELEEERDDLLETITALNEENSQLAHRLWCLENPE